MCIWENLLHDQQIELGGLSRNNAFKEFVANELPDELDDMVEETLTIETLMEAQHRCAEAFSERATRNIANFERIAHGLAQFEHAEIFLDAVGETPESYCLKRPGLMPEELRQMHQGDLTVGDVLKRRPAVILAPLLRGRVTMN